MMFQKPLQHFIFMYYLQTKPSNFYINCLVTNWCINKGYGNFAIKWAYKING